MGFGKRTINEEVAAPGAEVNVNVRPPSDVSLANQNLAYCPEIKSMGAVDSKWYSHTSRASSFRDVKRTSMFMGLVYQDLLGFIVESIWVVGKNTVNVRLPFFGFSRVVNGIR